MPKVEQIDRETAKELLAIPRAYYAGRMSPPATVNRELAFAKVISRIRQAERERLATVTPGMVKAGYKAYLVEMETIEGIKAAYLAMLKEGSTDAVHDAKGEG